MFLEAIPHSFSLEVGEELPNPGLRDGASALRLVELDLDGHAPPFVGGDGNQRVDDAFAKGLGGLRRCDGDLQLLGAAGDRLIEPRERLGALNHDLARLLGKLAGAELDQEAHAQHHERVHQQRHAEHRHEAPPVPESLQQLLAED